MHYWLYRGRHACRARSPANGALECSIESCMECSMGGSMECSMQWQGALWPLVRGIYLAQSMAKGMPPIEPLSEMCHTCVLKNGRTPVRMHATVVGSQWVGFSVEHPKK